ncbi:MAG: hypothetical protein ACK5YR_00770 [Pirellula sp.]
MMLRIIVSALTVAVLYSNSNVFSQDPPPSGISICDGSANTGATECLLDNIGKDICPDDASIPCNGGGVFCEYNPNVGLYQCWDAAPQTWRLIGFIKKHGAETEAIKWSRPAPGAQGKKSKPGIPWSQRVCREVFHCKCNFDLTTGSYSCDSEKCGELKILRLGRSDESCTEPGGPGAGGPGAGGPGGS